MGSQTAFRNRTAASLRKSLTMSLRHSAKSLSMGRCVSEFDAMDGPTLAEDEDGVMDIGPFRASYRPSPHSGRGL